MFETFDRYDHHDYGLIQIRPKVYVKCTNDCCRPKWLIDIPEGDEE